MMGDMEIPDELIDQRKPSLPATSANFLKPWTFIYVHRGRVTRFYLSQKLVD